MQTFIWTSFLLKNLYFLFYDLLFKVYCWRQINFLGGIDLGFAALGGKLPYMNIETQHKIRKRCLAQISETISKFSVWFLSCFVVVITTVANLLFSHIYPLRWRAYSVHHTLHHLHWPLSKVQGPFFLNENCSSLKCCGKEFLFEVRQSWVLHLVITTIHCSLWPCVSFNLVELQFPHLEN